jgi:deoxyribonuclease-4
MTLEKNLHETINKCDYTLQCFLGNPQSYVHRKLTKEDREKTIRICEEYDRSVYVHTCYLANLAHEDNDLRNKSINYLRSLTTEVKGLPVSSVLHIGKRGTIQRVVNGLEDLCLTRTTSHRTPYPILLENGAGQGTEIGINSEEIRKIYEGLNKTNVGICIDTAHAFASGMCSFENHESIIKLLDDLPIRPSMFHVNDSKVDFGQRKDRHENLKQGYIWSHNDESLISLVKICKEYEIDMICETPSDSTPILQDIACNYIKT